MKVIYYLSCFLLVGSAMNTAQANTYNSLSTSRINNVAESAVKPIPADTGIFLSQNVLSESEYDRAIVLSQHNEQNNFGNTVKLASVTFIAQALQTNASDRTGAVTQKNPTGQSRSSCEGYPYTTEMALANCETISRCWDGYFYHFKCASCKGGMAVSEGRCKCNRTTYPYSMYDTTCPYGYDEPLDNTETEQSKACAEMGTDGSLKKYYKNCVCPSGWMECTGSHQIGMGAACTLGDRSYYYICGCEYPYTSSCAGSRPLNSTDYCINLSKGGERNYNGCYQCDRSANSNYSLDEWWDSICPAVFSCGQ